MDRKEEVCLEHDERDSKQCGLVCRCSWVILAIDWSLSLDIFVTVVSFELVAHGSRFVLLPVKCSVLVLPGATHSQCSLTQSLLVALFVVLTNY